MSATQIVLVLGALAVLLCLVVILAGIMQRDVALQRKARNELTWIIFVAGIICIALQWNGAIF